MPNITWSNNQDANKLSLLKQRVENLASAPSSPVAGQIYWDTTLHKFGVYNGNTTSWDYMGTGAGAGDVTGQASSVDSEIVLFSGTGGKTIKRATGSGIAKITSGVLGTAAAGTDYVGPTTGSAIQKASSGQLTAATAGTDYSAGTSALATGILKSTTTSGALSIAAAGTDYLTGSSTNALTNKTLDANGTGNAVTNLEVADFAASAIVIASETIGSNNNDTTIPTSAAVKAYADSILGANDAMTFKGGIDASTNPNFPAANAGDTYRITVAGKIGGGSGVDVQAGALITAAVDGLSAGTQAAVGASWVVNQNDLDAASTTVAGYVELATVTEAEAKTDATRAVTPASLATFARRATGLVGNGALTALPFAHNLGNQYVTAQLFDASTNSLVMADTVLTDANTVTFTVAVAPATNALRVVCVG